MCCGPIRGETTLERRRVIKGLGSVLALGVPGLASRTASPADPPYLTFGLPAGVYDTAVLDALPGKKPLIKLSYRPPNYETPVSYFSSPITANDAFFVRYHSRRHT
jgi:sulfite dehydrogenase (cytochrome) subunit A